MSGGSPGRRIALTTALSRDALRHLRPLEDAGFSFVDLVELDGEVDERRLVTAFEGIWATIAGNEHYTRGVVEHLPDLRGVARWGVGYDSIDVEALTRAGVAVLTTPGANADAVADCALTLMLACVRRLLAVDAAVRDGRWRITELTGDLYDSTVGLIGLGAIGRAVARRLHGFGCRILAVEPYPDHAFADAHGVELVELDVLLARSDIVSLHTPLTDTTTGLIGARELAAMHPGAILINTSRGGAVDETALVAALRSGHLGAAGLDVFAREPAEAENPLCSMDRVVLSGHAATFTRGALRQTAEAVVENLLALDAGKVPRGCLNPDALARRAAAG